MAHRGGLAGRTARNLAVAREHVDQANLGRDGRVDGAEQSKPTTTPTTIPMTLPTAGLNSNGPILLPEEAHHVIPMGNRSGARSRRARASPTPRAPCRARPRSPRG